MISSAGAASSTEFSSIATTDSTTVSSVITAIGTPYCTARLIVPTSRVTRVTRSPVLAPSTRLSGSRRIVPTTYSRADASRSCPKSVEVICPANVNSVWASTTATITRARAPMPSAGPLAVTRSTSTPSSFGHGERRDGGGRVQEHHRHEPAPAGAHQVGGEPQDGPVVGDRPAALGAAGVGVDLLGPLAAGGVPASQPVDPAAQVGVRGRRVERGRQQRRVEGAVAPGLGGAGQEVRHGSPPG